MGSFAAKAVEEPMRWRSGQEPTSITSIPRVLQAVRAAPGTLYVLKLKVVEAFGASE